MPLADRTIEPVYLGRRQLREEEAGEEIVQVAVTQNALLGALVQLASLVRHADDLFCDLADECQKVFDHTERIIHKVKRIKEGVGHLDSKKVPIPVGNLKLFSCVQDHHIARHGFDCDNFATDRRPHCIKARYSMCEVTPAGALRGVDMYRKDGLHTSIQFKLWPITLQEQTIKTPDLNLPRHQHATAVKFNKKYKRLNPRPKTIHGVDSIHLDSNRIEDLLAHESLSKSQPSILVAVDTSGVGFHRMSSFRQSLKGTASLDRKKRRRTVSGVSENIIKEIEQFERGRKSIRTTPRPYSFDDLDAQPGPEPDELMMQYIDELDAKMEERAEQERASREPRLFKFLPCRRTRSLPRCIKAGASQSRGSMIFEQDTDNKNKDGSVVSTIAGHTSSSLSLGSTGSSASSKNTKRSSIISNKIKSFVSGTIRPRPKSLDLDAIDFLGAEDNEERATGSSGNLTRKRSPSMPDDIMTISSSQESQVGPGTYYYFNSNTLPRAQARKYEFPWDSLPKDWTTAVKLREISKRRREERNSSSGNWSGSSNRQSLDSARSSTLPSSTSQHSLGRDSGRDSPSLDDRSGTDTSSPTDKTTQDCLLSTFAPLKSFSAKDGTRDTEEWLRSLAQRAACREDATADMTASLSCLSLLTRQNIQELDSMSTGLQRPPKMDDEISSVYSLDQEGFYTSFHNDSGLRRSTNMLLEGEDDTHLTLVKEAHSSMLSIGSNNTIDSVIFRPFGASRTETAQEPDSSPVASQSHDEKSKKVRPLPPPRCGSCLSGNSPDTSAKNVSATGLSTILESAAVRVTKTSGEQSNSESDQETVCARVRSKTRISPHTFPSWCLISDEDSTDSSSSHLNQRSPQDAASVSLSGSRSHEGAGPMNPLPHTGSSVALEPSLQGEKGLEIGWKAVETGWKGSTLPRLYLESKVWEEDVQEQNNSWPRSRRSQHQQPTAGILKRDKSPAGTLKPKTLNFAPMVSYFDHQTPDGSEASLASSTLSSLESSSDQSCNYKLAMPFPSPSNGISDSLVDLKYQPTITVKPGRSGDCRIRSQIIYPPTLVKATSTPMSSNYLPGMSLGVVESSEGSVTSSQSSIPSLSDCGRGGYLDMSRSPGNPSLDTLSSSSSAALSDIDSSLTYVSSPNITPTNSVLRLDQDSSDTPTPVNSPSLERSANRTTSVPVNGASSCSSVHSSKSGSGSPVVLDSGPVLHSCPPPLVQIRSDCGHTETSNIVRSKSTRSFHDLGIPEQSSVGWMAEKLANRSRTNSLTMDSGFSSPTTPTTALVDSQQQECVKRSSPQCGTWPSSHYSQLHNPQPQMGDATLAPEAEINSGKNGRYVNASKHRISNPPTHLFLGHTHEPLEASNGATSFLASTPRTDSYRVAMNRDLNPQKHSLRSKHHPGRSFSSSDTSASSKNPPHPPRMTKTFSCPVGNLDDAVSRADSYRLAVRNTHGVLGELATRNTSYRMATREDDPMPEPNFRMDALNSWDRMQAKGGKDIRRMGITDVDQLKCYDDGSNFSRLSMSSVANKGFAGINSSRKKMKQEAHSLLRSDKTPSPDLKLPPKSGKSSKDKTRTQSSTYIRFDPIFEDKDDLYTSTHSLRTQSVEMLVSENGFLMSDKIVSQMPPGRLKTTGNKKPADEKAVMSILDSIKTTIKSISSKNSVDKDMWRYEGGI